MNKYYELNKDLDTCNIIVSSLGYGKCFHEKIKRLRKLYENEIKVLQKKAELGEHYKHLYSEVKKQKDNVVEYIKNKREQLHHSFDEPGWDYLFICNPDELLRMLGEIDDQTRI